MDAIQFILKEHAKVRHTLSKFKKTLSTSRKKQIFNSLCNDLIRHETMEEKVWYPHLKKSVQLRTVIKHLISEEKTAEKEIKKMNKIKESEEWDAKLQKFKKAVLHHAREEEKKLFPKVRATLDKKELSLLGKKLQAFKTKWKKTH